MSSTKDLIFSWVDEESPISSSSDMWRGATRASVAADGIAVLWTAKDAEGANARAHDEEDRMPARKRMERFIVECGSVTAAIKKKYGDRDVI